MGARLGKQDWKVGKESAGKAAATNILGRSTSSHTSAVLGAPLPPHGLSWPALLAAAFFARSTAICCLASSLVLGGGSQSCLSSPSTTGSHLRPGGGAAHCHNCHRHNCHTHQGEMGRGISELPAPPSPLPVLPCPVPTGPGPPTPPTHLPTPKTHPLPHLSMQRQSSLTLDMVPTYVRLQQGGCQECEMPRGLRGGPCSSVHSKPCRCGGEGGGRGCAFWWWWYAGGCCFGVLRAKPCRVRAKAAKLLAIPCYPPVVTLLTPRPPAVGIPASSCLPGG